MPTSRLLVPTFLVMALALFVWAPRQGVRGAAGGPQHYPETRRVDGSYVLHDERIEDPYRWLEDDGAEAVVAWDLAQASLLEEHLSSFADRERLAERLEAEFALGGMHSLPTFEAGARWFTYRPTGADHAVLYRTDVRATGNPLPILDPNTWSEDGTAGMKAWKVSPNGNFVAYRRDQNGSEETTLYVRDVASGTDLPDAIPRTKFSDIVWNEDSTGFFYTRMPDPASVPAGEAQYHSRMRFHELGTLAEDDPVVWGQGRPMLESPWFYRSSDEKRLFVCRGLPWQDFETFEAELKDGRLLTQPVITGCQDQTHVDCVGDTYILNSDRHTGNREIYTARRRIDASPGTWKKVPFPTGADGVMKDVVVVDKRLLVGHLKQNVVSRLFVTPLAGGAMREIPLPGPGTVGETIRTRKGDTSIWFQFESYDRPSTTYRCDVDSLALSLVAEETLPTTIDIATLVSTQTTYTSKDGAEVPIFLLHRRDAALDGSAPTLLYGYGGFRVGLYPGFSRSRAVWAELGGVLAVACLRGGDEFGEAWHEAGCLANKQNVYDDFIAAADWLVETGKATRGKLAIQGGSNGGLLTAVVANQRPDLCRAVISAVPLTDMLRFHRFQFARSWTLEYGDPDKKNEFAWIRPYSPYHNVKPGVAYPAILLTAGLSDGRVNAFHARKMAAQWQHASTSGRPVLLRIDRKGGHGAAGLKRALDGVLDEWAFALMAFDK